MDLFLVTHHLLFIFGNEIRLKTIKMYQENGYYQGKTC